MVAMLFVFINGTICIEFFISITLPSLLSIMLIGMRLFCEVLMKVVWLSSGVSSFIAGWLVRDSVDEWIYIDIKDQHPDSLRFIYDCENLIGKKITILRSNEFDSVESVCRWSHCVNSSFGAPCTGMLKRKVRKDWENSHKDVPLCYVWGFDFDESKRADSIRFHFPEFSHEFPLIEHGLSKQDCHALLSRLGIRRPLMYDLGYNNNNCIGCVKGGKGYWNRIRKDFPDVFASRSLMERDIGHSCINGWFLDELPVNAGRMSDEISQDCSVICFLTDL